MNTQRTVPESYKPKSHKVLMPVFKYAILLAAFPAERHSASSDHIVRFDSRMLRGAYVGAGTESALQSFL